MQEILAIRIVVEIAPSLDIAAAAAFAQQLADQHRCPVQFTFNGILCLANPGGSAHKLALAYCREVDRERRVTSSPEAP